MAETERDRGNTDASADSRRTFSLYRCAIHEAMRSASFGMISWRHSWNLLLARSQVAQGVTPVESHGPSEAALLVVNSRVSHKKNIDIMGTYIMSVGGASFFAEPKSWNSTLEAWNRLLGCKAGLITLIIMVFCRAQCFGVCKVLNLHDSRLHQSSA